MKILIRLPNWLGDMVMSVAFIDQLHTLYPGAELSVIAKKGIHELLPYFPPVKHQFVFSKEQYKGFGGLWQFGKDVSKTEKFDLFFCLPDSFSSAFMGYATGAKIRVGYKKELRELLLTNSFTKPKGLHRVQEYINIAERFTLQKATRLQVRLLYSFPKKEHLVFNMNSEASSRRLTQTKAVEILGLLQKTIPAKIILTGAPKEKEFVDAVLSQIKDQTNIESLAGKTNLPQLIEVLASAKLMLTTDSGPAHLANALGTHTVVLFGAGNENNTAPFTKHLRTIIRLGQLSCEPCEKNTCIRFGTPQCLELLDSTFIVNTVLQQLNSNG